MWQRLLLLGVVGAAGTLARYGLSIGVQRAHGGSFPMGTLVVNVLGCLLFGIVWPLAEERLRISGEARLIILTGFMGAFTTFSTYAFETGQFLRESEWLLAAANILSNNIIGLAALLLGLTIGKAI
jgi:fluoride exporter